MDGIIISLFLWILGLIILFFIIRHAIDSSRTASKYDDLIHEIRMLRNELKNQENKRKHIIDERI
ncbi:hypothetical protein [Paenibacillus sp. KN14-4R]|uniref:hypothetical protein n=1 Tax=Paenibacillus sp. KN14-4R TaxID=3445773 RepID=UPI003FA0D525